MVEAVQQANEKLKEAGAKRTVLLNVSGPFHSPLLEEAGDELKKVLDTVKFEELKMPYVTNVNAKEVSDINETKELLAKQVSSSVRWQQSMENMLENGVDTFVEIGPGRTLAGFMKKINKDAKVYNIAKLDDVDTVVNTIKMV